jgi:hypothetical protein
MEKQISSGLRYTFLLHSIAGLIFGLIFLLIPETYGMAANWPVKEPVIYRLIGGAVFSFGLTSYMAYQETEFAKVKIVVVQEIFWCCLGTLITVWAIIDGSLPTIAWINAAFLATFAAAFGYFYAKR